jgi:hypothetical protein
MKTYAIPTITSNGSVVATTLSTPLPATGEINAHKNPGSASIGFNL